MGGLAAAILVLFVVVYPVGGFRVPLGSDTPVYEWWARRAQFLGLRASDTGGRPAVVGAMAALEAVVPVGMGSVAAALGPALAAVAGLAAGSLVVVSLEGRGEDRALFVLTGLLSGVFLSFLVAGYLSTVAFAALFLAALAALTRSFGAGRAAVAASAVMGGAAALSHPIFLAVASVIVAGGALALVPAFRADRAAGVPAGRTALARVGLAAAGTAVVLGGGLVAGGLRTPTTVDTSRDAFLRRAGLTGLIERSYTAVLTHTFTWWRSLTVVLGATGGATLAVSRPSAGTERDRDDRRRWFWGLTGTWVAVTVGAVAALLAGFRVPGQRFAQFALPLPIVAAVGFVAARRRWGRTWGTAFAVVGSAAFVGALGSAWWSGRPFVPAESLAQAHTAGRFLADGTPGTPIFLVADDRHSAPARYLIRDLNYVRAELPPARALDLTLWVGSPMDLARGIPHVTGLPEHDRLALLSLPDRPIGPSEAIVLESLDPAAFAQAIRLAGVIRPGPGVAVLPGPDGAPPRSAGGSSAAGAGPGEGPIAPWAPVWLALGLVVLFALVGAPWAHLALRHASRLVRLGLAPALGLASVGLASILVDSVGLRLGTPVGAGVAIVGGFALGVAAVVARSRLLPGAAVLSG